jgi:hypothetical protein
MKLRLSISVLLFVMANVSVAGAEAQTIAAARELAKQGFEDYDLGRYASAFDKSIRAYHVVRLPTLAVNAARSLVKLNQWLKAAELYLEATNIESSTNWQAVQFEAKIDAERERAELLTQIPRLRLRIDAVKPNLVAVSIDGVAVTGSSIQNELLVDPGQHVVVGVLDSFSVNQTVSVRANERSEVTLVFPRRAKPSAESQKLTVTPLRQDESSPSHNLRRTLGWGVGAVGATSLLIGTVSGYFAISKRNSIIDSGTCDSGGVHCSIEQNDSIRSYRTLRTVSGAGLIAGGFLGAIGVALLVWPDDQTGTERVSLRVSGAGLKLEGHL